MSVKVTSIVSATWPVLGSVALTGSAASVVSAAPSGSADAASVSSGSTFYTRPAMTIPAGAITYDGTTSLGAALTALPAGGTLVLDYDGSRVENVDVALADNATILNADGRSPWLDGSLRISAGEGVRVYGLNVKWTTPDPGGHMVKVDGGSPEWAYSEVTIPGAAGCYTLMRPGQAIHDWRVHHCWIHDNPGVASHDGNQDHGLYIDADNPTQHGLVDHCLIENMPRGRNVKIGGPSSGTTIGLVTIQTCTLRTGYGPSNGQVSNGAQDTTWDHLLLIDSGATTALTDGSGSGPGNVYTDCKADRPVGEDTANFADGGGNVGNVAVATLEDYATQGAAGYGHLAP